MKKLKAGLSVLLFCIVLAYALAFSATNNQVIGLDFLIGSPISWPFALWLGLFVLIGSVLGLLSGVVIIMRQKLQIRRLNKELMDARHRLSKLS